MAVLALAAVVLALLVWAGRRPARLAQPHRIARALFSAFAAAAAVVVGLRGEWLASLALVGLSGWLISGVRGRPLRRPAAGGMGLEEARATLGVGPEATTVEIEAAYRRLIRRAHPDQGGTAGLAAQLNAARDRLLK